jgi:hypothetical protein
VQFSSPVMGISRKQPCSWALAAPLYRMLNDKAVSAQKSPKISLREATEKT